ncbi:hypothetical protein OROGR_008356 [Orobanche gracilis]
MASEAINLKRRECSSHVKNLNNLEGGGGNIESRKWSPLLEGIVTELSPNSKFDERAVKIIDDHIDNHVLYGTGKSRLPVFEELCRERK